jgi:hypothetical protein
MGVRPKTLTLPQGRVPYETHRARALVLAGRGEADVALAELNEGWTDEWPSPTVYATDVARVHFLAGRYGDAVEALHLAVRGAHEAERDVPRLAHACVRREHRVWRRALDLAFAGGTLAQRWRTAWAVVSARLA